MERLRARLAEHALIGLDAGVFIYHVEAHPRYEPLTRCVLRAVERGRPRGVASVVAVMELTVHPWRMGRAGVAREVETLLAFFPNLALVDVTRDVARRAAQLRARFDVRPADALHVATALDRGATAFVTNDRRLSRLSADIEVLQLDDFLADAAGASRRAAPSPDE